MSVAFPVFEKAQVDHMGFDRSRNSFSASIFESLEGGEQHRSLSSSALDLNRDNGAQPPAAAAPPPAAKPRITKRINARLQLAAALVEADNEKILQRAQDWPSHHPRSSSDDGLQPPPPPEPKLASQSAIFAPYREDSAPLLHHTRTFSDASRLSRLIAGGGNNDDDGNRRPSIDFLGVALPTEVRSQSRAGGSSRMRAHSRAGSALSFQNGGAPLKPGEVVVAEDHARSASAFGATSIADAGDDALSGWGVEKFLSKEERERIAVGKRSRANSVAGFTIARPEHDDGAASVPAAAPAIGRASMDMDSRPHVMPMADPGVSKCHGRARSEIIAASGASSLLDSRAELMARIKLYRERQENLSPSEWSGPGPTASKDEVMEHLLATSNATSAGAAQTALGDKSGAGALADSSHSVLDRPRPHSRSASFSSNHMVSSAGAPPASTSSALAEIAGDKLEQDHIPTSKSFEKERVVSTRHSHRHLSIFGVTGDNWSDQDQDSEAGDATVKSATAAGPLPLSSLGTEITGASPPKVDASVPAAEAEAAAAEVAAEAPAAAPAASSIATPGQRQSQLAYPLSGPRPAFALATSDQLTKAFGRRNSAIVQQLDGSAPMTKGDDSGEEMDMAGIGSYSRSQSRRNSLMATAMMSSTNLGGGGETTAQQFHQQLPPSRPGTPGGIFASSRALPEDPFSGLPLDPGPYAAGFAGFAATSATAVGSASPMKGSGAFPGSPSHLMSQLSMIGETAASAPRPNRATAAMSTRQLQALARSTTFPEHFGMGGGLYTGVVIGDDGEEIDFAPNEDPDFAGPILGPEALADELASQTRPNLPIQLGDGTPDLSSANWGKPKKKWYRASRMSMLSVVGGGGDRRSKDFDSVNLDDGHAVTAEGTSAVKASSTEGIDGGELGDLGGFYSNDVNAAADENDDAPLGMRRDVSEAYANEPASEVFQDMREGSGAGNNDDVDDDYISPPRKGPLRPRGLEARLPKTLIMPQPLQGTRLAPKLRLTDGGRGADERRQSGIYVPEGFVLHDGKGLPPTRSLQVTSANGPRPLFASSGGDQRLEELVSDIKTVEVTRTLHIPAAAPRGIGRRAGAPTTALFRNQLVQHDDEKEGWGWELGTRADEAKIRPDAPDSDEEVPLADLRKRGRAAKRAAKKLAKAKRKRKQARRERRAKRVQAVEAGRPYEDFGVAELSPDEDLDLSDTTSGSEQTEYETNSDEWDSADEKRWVDENKPAGKLFGKSLLDLAEERNQVRKTKARFYGQAQLEDEEAFERSSALRVPGASDDAASIAPSMAKSFRENPLGYNDTKERMEATFGTDTLWVREMAKRQEDEAKEKEEAEIRRLAEEEFRREEEARRQRKKDKRLFRSGKSKEQRKSGSGPGGSGAPSTTDSPALGSSTTGSRAVSRNDGSGSVSPVRFKTPANAPVIDLDLGLAGPGKSKRRHKKNANSAAAEWFVQSSDEEEDEDDESSSDDEMTRRQQAMQRVRLSRNLTGTVASGSLAAELAKHGINVGGDRDADNNESSDDDVPLVQIKRAAADKRASMAPSMLLNGQGGGGGGDDEESSEEELTLAAIRARRQQASGQLNKLDLALSAGGGASGGKGSGESSPGLSQPSSLGRSSAKGLPGSSSLSQELSSIWNLQVEKQRAAGAAVADDNDSDEDVPLGMRHPNGFEALRAAQGSDDEDNRPLGAAHPQAAIIAEQAELIRQLRAENDQTRMSIVSPPWPTMGGGGMGQFGGSMPSMMNMNMGMGMPMGMGGGGGGAASTLWFGGGVGAPAGSMMGLAHSHHHLPNPAPAINIDAASPHTVTGYLPPPGEDTPMSMPMPMPMPMAPPSAMGMMLDPKASTILNWRTQVPADASGGAPTPTGSGSTSTSAINSQH